MKMLSDLRGVSWMGWRCTRAASAGWGTILSGLLTSALACSQTQGTGRLEERSRATTVHQGCRVLHELQPGQRRSMELSQPLSCAR